MGRTYKNFKKEKRWSRKDELEKKIEKNENKYKFKFKLNDYGYDKKSR